MSVRARHGLAWAPLLAVALLAAACGGGGDRTVEVTLEEFDVIPSESTVGAGEVTFNVTNEGPDDVHEFVVFKTDLTPDALPTGEDGSVDETGQGLELIDEIEDIAVGEAPSLTVDLEVGNYVLICNIYDATELEAHYQEGMRVAFAVE
jgi:uncharacterized cupredoxin-like copper-binding protein